MLGASLDCFTHGEWTCFSMKLPNLLKAKMTMPKNSYPKRIVCLTEESVELLMPLGEEDRIVGVSAYVERLRCGRTRKEDISLYSCSN